MSHAPADGICFPSRSRCGGIHPGKLKELEGPSVTLRLKEGVEGFVHLSVISRLVSLLPLICCILSAIGACGSQSQTLSGTPVALPGRVVSQLCC